METIDQLHKEWKEYYKCQKKEMEREHKLAVRCIEKLREEMHFKGEEPTNIQRREAGIHGRVPTRKEWDGCRRVLIGTMNCSRKQS
jgi:hypothetical protein